MEMLKKKRTIKKVVKALKKASKAHAGQAKMLSKPYARKIQILTVGEQRAKVMGKAKVASIFKKGKETIRKGKKKT
jgi:hypothetical protein